MSNHLPFHLTLTVGYALAVFVGLVAIFFAFRAISVLRRPPTGEAGRELVFLTGRELIPALSLVGIVLVVEWIEWIVSGLRGAGVVSLSSFTFYANIGQGLVLFVAAIMAYNVLVPYTRARRNQHTRMVLDRLAARVALLRGRR